MTRILSAALATLLFFASAEHASAQSPRIRVEESQRVQESEGGAFFETSPIDSPTVVKEGDLFTLMFRTGIVFRVRCYYVISDPCPEFSFQLRSLDVASSLAQRSQVLLSRMLDERGIVERLEALTVERIREDVRRQRGDDEPGSGMSGTVSGRPVPPHEHPHEHEPRFAAPNANRLLLGTAMFAGGGVLSASRNEWAIDEGYIGVGIAAVGLALVFKELVPEWRGLRFESSGANLSVAW